MKSPLAIFEFLSLQNRTRVFYDCFKRRISYQSISLQTFHFKHFFCLRRFILLTILSIHSIYRYSKFALVKRDVKWMIEYLIDYTQLSFRVKPRCSTKLTGIRETRPVRLNLQESRIHRESVIDIIILFMNIIWGIFDDICIHESEKIFLVTCYNHFIHNIGQSDIIRRS